MDYIDQLPKRITPSLVEDISKKINENYTVGTESVQSRKGIFIPDNLGISILADDSANEPMAICVRTPIPQTTVEAAILLTIWKGAWDCLGENENILPEAILYACFEMLKEEILDISAVAKLVGAYQVKNMLDSGINLIDQASNNRKNVGNRTIKAQFSIFLADNFLEFQSVIGRRLPLRRTT